MIKLYINPIIIHLFYLIHFQLILHFNLTQLSIYNLSSIMILIILNQMKKYQIILNQSINLIFKFITNNIQATYKLKFLLLKYLLMYFYFILIHQNLII